MREVQRIEAADGHRMHLYVHRPDEGDRGRAVILLHGIFANRDETEDVGELLSNVGLTALRFDFRGHGDSAWPSTSFSPLSALRDVHAAVLWCALNSLAVSFLGISYGGGSALNYVALNPGFEPERLVLLSPVIDYKATFIEPELDWGKALFTKERVKALRDTNTARLMPHFRAGGGLYDEMMVLEPYEVLRSIQAPTLVIHGNCDEKVPVSAARHHVDRLGEPVKYVEIEGGGHGLRAGEQGRYVDDLIVSWLKG